jgi:Fe-Mn family superoxide dismutase
MAFSLPPLPYPEQALEPHMSAETLTLHHGAHHRSYVDTLNKLVAGSPLAERPLVEVIRATAGKADQAKIFNNAAQVWNHEFFFNCLRPGGGGRPTGPLADAIDSAFGGYDGFAAAFKEKALGQFGSGWAWLVRQGDRVTIVTTANADTPIAGRDTPLLTCDVWEHAYYVDHRNRRPAFLDTFLGQLVNWEFAAAQFQ